MWKQMILLMKVVTACRCLNYYHSPTADSEATHSENSQYFANISRVNFFQIGCSKQLNKTHNFRKIIFVTSSLQDSIAIRHQLMMQLTAAIHISHPSPQYFCWIPWCEGRPCFSLPWGCPSIRGKGRIGGVATLTMYPSKIHTQVFDVVRTKALHCIFADKSFFIHGNKICQNFLEIICQKLIISKVLSDS